MVALQVTAYLLGTEILPNQLINHSSNFRCHFSVFLIGCETLAPLNHFTSPIVGIHCGSGGAVTSDIPADGRGMPSKSFSNVLLAIALAQGIPDVKPFFI